MSTDRRAVMDFFNQVLDQSLIPVLIYSFPYVRSQSSTTVPHVGVLEDHAYPTEADVECTAVAPRASTSALRSSSISQTIPCVLESRQVSIFPPYDWRKEAQLLRPSHRIDVVLCAAHMRDRRQRATLGNVDHVPTLPEAAPGCVV
jgi:hypothetical protein